MAARSVIFFLPLALALSGCVTASEYAAQVAAADDGDCRSYGADPGTQAYFQCRMTKSEQHEIVMAVARQQANENFNRGLAMMAGSFGPVATRPATILSGY